jgi:dihydroneopterin aldolase
MPDSDCDAVYLRGFRGQTIIGIRDNELHEPQTLAIDLVVGRARLQACRSDDIADTVDYSALRKWLLGYLQDHGQRLLEAFAARLADLVLEEFRADWVQVSVAKPRRYPDVEEVGVRIERRRQRSRHQDADILRLIGGGMSPRP